MTSVLDNSSWEAHEIPLDLWRQVLEAKSFEPEPRTYVNSMVNPSLIGRIYIIWVYAIRGRIEDS